MSFPILVHIQLKMLDIPGKKQPEKTRCFRKLRLFQTSFLFIRAKQNKPPTTKVPSGFFRKFLYKYDYSFAFKIVK